MVFETLRSFFLYLLIENSPPIGCFTLRCRVLIWRRSWATFCLLQQKDLVVWSSIIIPPKPSNIMLWRVALNPAFLVKGSPPVCKLAPVVHHATFELFDAVQFIATSLVETCHIIFAITVAPAFVVEGFPDIMVITAEITTGQVAGLTATAFLDVTKGISSVAV